MHKIKVTALLAFSLIQLSVLRAQEKIKFADNRSPATEQLRLGFTGDILIHEDLYKKVDQSKSKDFSQLWPSIIPAFEKADFMYANLEGPTALGITKDRKDVGDIGFVYDKNVYSGTDFVFNYHPRLLDDLKKSGIDIVSTANNHTFDRASIGIDRTIDAIKKSGLEFVGTRKVNSAAEFYNITTVKNFNVAWIACSELLNGFKDKFSQILLCSEQADEIVKIIAELKARKDIDAIIVAPHWGIEYKHEPSANQKKYAQAYIEAGASAVIGSHPHVLQPVQKYTAKDGREAFIAYSLGNFAAFQKDIDRKASAVIYLDFSKDSAGKVWISNYTYEPTLRSGTEIFLARKNKEAVKHIEQYLGPLE